MKVRMVSFPPFILFWIGVLTGAVLIGLLFLYKLYSPELGGTNVFRTLTTPVQQSTQLNTTNLGNTSKTLITNPIGAQDPDPW
jgi:hypothetical protein